MTAFASDPEASHKAHRRDAANILSAAFPGLFDGTEWIAPWEATAGMAEALWIGNRETAQAWKTLRDAYLKEQEKKP